MCNRLDCVNNIGRWVHFQTPWGTHRGIITETNQRAVLMRVPRQYAPNSLATFSADADDEKRLDATLAGWGYPGGYGVYGGYGGRRWGYPGYGAWGGGWWWWWLAFAWIFWLAFLW